MAREIVMRPQLAVESNLTRLVRILLRELKRHVHPNVSFTVQTDFDAETGDELHVTDLASLPGRSSSSTALLA